MFILTLFAFLGGIITVLSPCILPVLPIVLSGSLTGGKQRPLGIVTGFILSFTFFTLFLSAIVRATGVSPDALRNFSVFILVLFGLSLFIPKLQIWMEKLFSKLSSFIQTKKQSNNAAILQSDFLSGIPVGASLGLIWTPCVGPIIASVITLAATSQVNGAAVILTLAYSIGTAIPMLAITYGGRQLLNKNQWLLTNLGKIQKSFGVLMIVTAMGIYFNIDRTFQTFILNAFPQYGTGLTALEDNALVRNALDALNKPTNDTLIGKPMNRENFKLPILKKAPGFQNQSGIWINSEPLTLESLKGKVVLVDFWTYTCINCIRTLPYIRSWNEKYKDQGLVIVGVHTPEFEFEKSADNVKKAVSEFQLTHPIVQDNNFGIWRDYNNRFWPAKYLIDKDSNVRYTHFGEGAYDETEQAIQELLKETGTQVSTTINNPNYQTYAKTHELYLGSERIEFIVSPETVKENRPILYSAPKTLPRSTFAYQGTWTIMPEYAQPDKGSKLILHFEAKEVFLVVRPKTPGTTSILNVFFHDNPVTTGAGEDLKASTVTVSEDRLYKLLNLSSPASGILTIEAQDNNVELFAFTFG